jgi:succinate dehydrogenase / fumarate reductase cytochrome b subunit
MKSRPLSPHLQVYRLPLTALVSITHRATGVVLSVGFCLLTIGLMVSSGGESAYADVQHHLQAWWGQIFLWGWIFSLSFHLCHGVRHLIWDAGMSYEKATLNRYATIEIGAAMALTLAAALLT